MTIGLQDLGDLEDFEDKTTSNTEHRFKNSEVL